MLLSRLLHWKYSHVLTYCEHEFLISGVELCRSNWGICIIIINVFSGCVCYQFCMLSSVCDCVCLCLCLCLHVSGSLWVCETINITSPLPHSTKSLCSFHSGLPTMFDFNHNPIIISALELLSHVQIPVSFTPLCDILRIFDYWFELWSPALKILFVA